MTCDMAFDKQPYYNQGKKAYEENKELGEADCPYPIGKKGRADWYAGWLDARTKDRLESKKENKNDAS